MNLGILRCFEILSWYALFSSCCLATLLEKKPAGSRRRFALSYPDREGPGNGCTSVVQISVSQKIFLPVVPVKFVYQGTSSPWLQLNLDMRLIQVNC